MSEHKFILPLAVFLPRKTKADKKIIINQNVVIPLHYHSYNDAKIVFTNLMKSQLEGLEIETPVNINYQLFKGSKRKSDKMNVLAAQSKFFLDAITHYECWEDDNDECVKYELMMPTEYDKENPRVEVTIKTVKKKSGTFAL